MNVAKEKENKFGRMDKQERKEEKGNKKIIRPYKVTLKKTISQEKIGRMWKSKKEKNKKVTEKETERN